MMDNKELDSLSLVGFLQMPWDREQFHGTWGGKFRPLRDSDDMGLDGRASDTHLRDCQLGLLAKHHLTS